MTNVTILIPDISGYTRFLSQTAIKHATHIVNELLETIIAANNTDFYISEIEGDAVLMYRKGEPLSGKKLVQQCIDMFLAFHKQLKIIERDSVCQCGACRTASNLTLKFVAHFGVIEEIKVSKFISAAGVDMIVAHRLMKNQINHNEYILLTKNCIEACGNCHSEKDLNWTENFEEYENLGKIEYEYTVLEDLRKDIPEPPPPEPAPFPTDKARSIAVEINAPIQLIYQNLLDTDKRNDWVNGMHRMERQPVAERAGAHHYCVTNGIGIDHWVVNTKFDNNEITFIEKARMRKIGITVFNYYKVEKTEENRAKLSYKIAYPKKRWWNPFFEKILLKNVFGDLQNLKKLCELGGVSDQESGVKNML